MTTPKLIRLSLFGALLFLLLPFATVHADRPSLQSLQEQINQLQAQVNALQADNTALKAKLACQTMVGNEVYFTGCNVNIRSGSGSTNGPVNGLGNLIVGYNEPPAPRFAAARTTSS